ncbi:glycoside hydrolase family 3 protein [Alteromonas sp. BL110]|uniref:glycoside hydrolase family 3 protein n=1 Tax=Alteromonas sp. BL110 TaxID=1714845 RepID=UPI000E46D396|nr:glycoside hydrolase family 3 N-terminal domain-containing protein [Alteromonas sp. BL110]AXT38454.1 glycoside hydrolase family 3 protein [Alteromonas sp. BL110]RKM83801.1 glycoside hydrolase family 3 protein [Alteromonas sp. BL110]
MSKLITISVILSLVCGLAACKSENNSQTPSAKNAADIWPKLDIAVKQDPQVEEQVKQILATMTLKQKVAQMIQPEIRDISVADMRKYGFGSYLNGGGAFPNNKKHSSADDWVKLADEMYLASVDDSLDGTTIPTMWGTDAVHGHNNVIGATLFPHNIGLGAANNPDLIERIANITATEVMATGIDWVFAPTVAVVRDDRWGRTYEGYSEDPEIVRNYAASIVKGLQGEANKDFLSDNRVISTVKHFIGDGGTLDGDDQGDNISSEQELFDIHAQGYVGGLTAGAQSVMASFNSWQGDKIHGNQYLLTEVLKKQMGFDGFVVGDWNGHGQVENCSNESCPQAVNAGLDIFMVPTGAWLPLYENTIAQVKNGTIPMSRINDAVTRILRVKVRAGLFDKPNPAKRKFSGQSELIGHKSHREVARQAVRESLVLLKNKNHLLPLDPKQTILIAGDAADNIGKQSGGWSITWQGTNNSNADFPGGSSIFAGLSKQINAAGGQVELNEHGDFTNKPDVAIVVFGEEPYAEGHGDRASLAYQQGNKRDLALLKKLKAQGIPVVAVFISGRPMWVNAELNTSDAFVAAWLPGSEGDGIAEVILANPDGSIQHDFKGKLSFSWPKSAQQTTVNHGDLDYAPLLPYGFGLTYQDENLLADNLSEQVELNLNQTQRTMLYTGAMHKPWEMHLFSGEKEIAVNSNSHQLNGLTFRTVDREVQEDSFLVNLDGNQLSGVKIVSESHFKEDLNQEFLAGSTISMLIKVTKKPSDNVYIAMNCESFGDDAGSCSGRLDISSIVDALPVDEWHPLNIDLQCFAKMGIKFDSLVSPFSLESAGAMQISLSEIGFIPQPSDEATFSCN